MDLKSMLNDSAAQRPPPPRIHTSTSSISDRPYDHQTPLQAQPDRPTPHPTSAYPADGRPGSYFAISPRQHNSASTSSAGAHSAHGAYGQSPGPPAQHMTPRRDSVTPQHVYTPGHIPPPSPIGVPPSTPGAQYHSGHPTSYNQSFTPQSASNQRPPTRDEYAQANGRLHQHPMSQMSPPPHHSLHTPSTPLGPPPANYPRPSTHSQRPPSQGYDHLRRSSIGSMGSNHSRDPSMSHIIHHDTDRRGSIQRTHSGDDERLRQERERSDESVSPKTIPRPPPHRTSSTFSQSYDQSPAGSLTSQHASPGGPYKAENQDPATVQNNVQQQPVQPLDARTQPMSRPSPGARPTASVTPQSTHSSLPAQPSPSSTKPPSKKRTASVISTAPQTAMPPMKRIKREEVPIWARSVRKRRLFLGNNPRQRQRRAENSEIIDLKQETTPVGNAKPGHSRPPPQPQDFGLSIMNQKPRNDLIYVICEWIFLTLASQTLPLGSVFEIEAKLGQIWDIEKNDRLRLPVNSEAVFARDKTRMKTRFDTSVMSRDAHQGLNEFLNHVVEHNKMEIDRGVPRDPMDYAHTVEYDEYDELNTLGRNNMQRLAHWANLNHKMKVRRTFRKSDQALTAQIIKTRVADLEVYNPNDTFDYRVSISLETPWNGDPSEIAPPDPKAPAPSDRLKNRLSYKHRDYQIDLTQIDHTQQGRVTSQDHEVEVELMNDSFMPAFTEAKETGNGDRYETLIGGFIDNIRVLAGHASRAVLHGAQQQQQQQQRPPGH